MKSLDKIISAIGDDTKQELDGMTEDRLRNVIVQANAAMEQVEKELEANERYQEIKQQKTALESGKKEVDKRQKAKIAYALFRLSEVGADLGAPTTGGSDAEV